MNKLSVSIQTGILHTTKRSHHLTFHFSELASPDQQFALNLLLQAGVDDLTEDIINQLPLVSDIHAQYGTKPIVHNLESCERFRHSYPPGERFMAVAGMFNTGTNILGNLIVHNCAIPRPKGKKGTGMRQQVPWGKRKCISFD